MHTSGPTLVKLGLGLLLSVEALATATDYCLPPSFVAHAPRSFGLSHYQLIALLLQGLRWVWFGRKITLHLYTLLIVTRTLYVYKGI